MIRPRVAVVIVNWNGWRHTVTCLESVQQLRYPDLQVVLVDNDSGPEDREALRPWADRVTLVELEQNLGFAGGYNAGIRRALLDPAVAYVFVLNNDTTVDPDCVSGLVQAAQTRQADMVSPVVLAASDRRTVDRLGLVLSTALLGFNMTRWEDREPFCPSGCAALYSRRLLESVALDGEYFDEDFFAYVEDLDLGIRAVLHGYRCVLAREALVYHYGAAASPPGSLLPLRLRHRNTIWCLLKSVPVQTLLRHAGWIAVAQLLGVVRAAARGQGTAVVGAEVAGLGGVHRMVRKRRAMSLRGPMDVHALERTLDPRPFYLFSNFSSRGLP